MAIFLNNEDVAQSLTMSETIEAVAQSLTMSETIEAVEKAYYELGMGHAWNNPRIHTYGQAKNGATHFLKVFTGTVPELGYSILRIDSTLEYNEAEHATSRKVGSRHIGWLLMFSVETGDLEAIIEEKQLQRQRVGAMTGIAAKFLARENSHTVGIFGSGAQAGPQLEALCAVRKIKRVNVYSPTKANREAFAATMTQALNTEVAAVGSPKEAVVGCDIVVVATNSNEPVFDGHWLEVGTYVSSIVNSDRHMPRKDLDDESFRRASVIVVSTRDQIQNDEPTWLTDGLQSGTVGWDRIWEIGELVCGKSPGRTNNNEITILKNNGLSVQFAGVGAAIMDKAKQHGRGRELPGFLFEKAYRT